MHSCLSIGYSLCRITHTLKKFVGNEIILPLQKSTKIKYYTLNVSQDTQHKLTFVNLYMCNSSANVNNAFWIQ